MYGEAVSRGADVEGVGESPPLLLASFIRVAIGFLACRGAT